MLFDESYDDIPQNSFEKFDFISDQIAQYCTDEGKYRLQCLMPEILETAEYNRQKFLNLDHHQIWADLGKNN